MIKRVLWFAIGIVIGAFAINRIRDYLRRRAPEVLSNKVAETAGGLGDAAGDFADRVRAAMAEREQEIRDALGQAQESPLGETPDGPLGRPQPDSTSER